MVFSQSLDNRQGLYDKARHILDSLNDEQKYYLKKTKDLSGLAKLCLDKNSNFDLSKKENRQAMQAMALGLNANFLTSLLYIPDHLLRNYFDIHKGIDLSIAPIFDKSTLNKRTLRRHGLFKKSYIYLIRDYELSQDFNRTNKLIVPGVETTADAILEYQKKSSKKIENISKNLAKELIKIHYRSYNASNIFGTFPTVELELKEKKEDSIFKKLINSDSNVDDFYGFSFTLSELIQPGNFAAFNKSHLNGLVDYIKSSEKVNMTYDEKHWNQYIKNTRSILGLQMYLSPTEKSNIDFPFPKLITDPTDMKVSVHLLDLLAKAQNTLGGYDSVAHFFYKHPEFDSNDLMNKELVLPKIVPKTKEESNLWNMLYFNDLQD